MTMILFLIWHWKQKQQKWKEPRGTIQTKKQKIFTARETIKQCKINLEKCLQICFLIWAYYPKYISTSCRSTAKTQSIRLKTGWWNWTDNFPKDTQMANRNMKMCFNKDKNSKSLGEKVKEEGEKENEKGAGGLDWLCPILRRHRICSVQFNSSVMSDSLRPRRLQHATPPCPSPTPGACPDACPLSHDAIQSSHPVVPFSSCLQSFQASGSFLKSKFTVSGFQSIGASASASVLPMNIQDCFF